MRRLLNTLRSQIKYKIILPYLLLTSLVMLIGAGIAIYFVASSWQERFNNQLGQVARNFADTLAQREQGNIDFLALIALAPANSEQNIPAVADALQSHDEEGLALALQSFYDVATLPNNSFNVVLDRLIAFDRTGQSLIHWERVDPENPQQRVEHQGTDLAQLELIQKVLQGETDTIGDKYAALITFRDVRTPGGGFAADEYYFFTVVPVRMQVLVNANNPAAGTREEIVGGVLIASRLGNLLEVLERQSQSEISAIYDASGLALSSTTLPKEGLHAINMPVDMPQRLRNQVGDAQAYMQCFDAAPQTLWPLNPRQPACSILDVVQVNQRDFQFLYAPLVIRDAQVGHFSVGLSQDYVTAPLTDSRNVVLIITFALALGAIMLGYHIARQITRPLSDLVATAEAVTLGQLDQRSSVLEQNEFGTLAMAFNQMTEYLLRLYTTSRELNSTIEVSQVLDVVTGVACSFRADTNAVALLKEGAAWRYYFAHELTDQFKHLADFRLAYDPELFHILEQSPVTRTLHSNNSEDATLLDLIDLYPTAGFQTVLLTPVLIENRLHGLLAIGHADPYAFGEAEESVLAVIATMGVNVLRNAVLFMRVQQDATERKAILTSIGDAVVVVDHHKMIALANPVAEQMLGIADWQTRQRTFDELALQPVVARELFGREYGHEHYRIGDKIVTRTNAPVTLNSTRSLGEVIVLHDITAEAAVDQAKTDFIATISHELRTPLTVIRGYVDLLLRGTGGTLTADQTELLDSVRIRAIEMTSLVNNVIMIANIEAGTLSTELQPQDTAMILKMALMPLRPIFETKGLYLHLEESSDDLPPVLADREQLKMMLTQLIDNALRYTSEGGITIRTFVNQDSMIQIDIQDTGPGIPPEIAGRLFTRFQRIDGNSSTQRGSGLGLAITRELAQRQKGWVSITRTSTAGSTFSLIIPQANEQDFAITQQAASTAS